MAFWQSIACDGLAEKQSEWVDRPCTQSFESESRGEGMEYDASLACVPEQCLRTKE